MAVHSTEIPNYKPQIPNKSQIQNFKLQTCLEFELWRLSIVWNLFSGNWSFRAVRGVALNRSADERQR